MPQDSVDLSQSPESCLMQDSINRQQYFVLQLFPGMRHDGECKRLVARSPGISRGISTCEEAWISNDGPPVTMLALY